MGGSVALGGLAVLAAFCCGSALAGAAAIRMPRSPFGADGANRLRRRVRNGVRWTLPASRVLLKRRRVAEVASQAVWAVRAKGFETSEPALLSVFVAATLCAAVLAGLVARSPVCAVAVAALACAVALAWARAAHERRREEVRQAVPDALRSMGVCFQSGLSLLQTLKQVASEAEGSLKDLFERAAHRMETGGSAQDALRVLRGGSAVSELAFVAVALDVQHQAGGSMRQVLDAARETVEGEMELRRSLRVQTAQAKLSARVVSVMPFALIALFSLVSEGFLTPFFSSPWGLALLALAFGMQAAGILAVRRMLAVEVRG